MRTVIYMKHIYPTRIEENIWRQAKAKAALEGVTMREVIEQILKAWAEGKIKLEKK